MSIRPIYLYGSRILRETAKPVSSVTPDIIKLVYDMFETMHASSGIGLAATQVGSLDRVIVIDISGVESDENDANEGEGTKKRLRTSPGMPSVLSLVNPEVISSEGEVVMEEGCLSIPDVRGDVERPEKIRVQYRDTTFTVQEFEADGLLARVLQHEIDHLNGVLFIDHLSKTERGMLTTKLRRVKKGTVETSYPVKTMEQERLEA